MLTPDWPANEVFRVKKMDATDGIRTRDVSGHSQAA